MTGLITTAISLIGIYIAFALAASWLNEQFATFLALRSKTLIAGVRSMIGDAAAADFYGHPLILALGESSAKSWGARFGALFGLKFVRQNVRTPAVGAGRDLQTNPPPYVSSDHFATVLLDVLRGKLPGGTTLSAIGASSTDISAALNVLGDPTSPYKPLHDVLLPLWRDAQNDYDRFSASVASWYDSQMDRVSGWYKRNAQIVLAYIGLALALTFNVDTIAIVDDLQRDAYLSQAIASATQRYYGSVHDAGKDAPCPSTGACICADGFTPYPPTTPDHCRLDDSALSRLPIGWTTTRIHSLFGGPHPFVTVLLKVVGLAITVVAILLGAPFWFDILGSIVNVRSAGAKPSTNTS